MYYRLYFMNCGSGHIDRIEEIEAADDVEAVRTAAGRDAGDQPLELWQERRKVKRFEVGTARLKVDSVCEHATRASERV